VGRAVRTDLAVEGTKVDTDDSHFAVVMREGMVQSRLENLRKASFHIGTLLERSIIFAYEWALAVTCVEVSYRLPPCLHDIAEEAAPRFPRAETEPPTMPPIARRPLPAPDLRQSSGGSKASLT
jgi:hypothetical protein